MKPIKYESDTPTPRTDAETFDIPIHGADGTGSRSAVVRYHFACTLERELAAALNERDEVYSLACKLHDIHIAPMRAEIIEQIFQAFDIISARLGKDTPENIADTMEDAAKIIKLHDLERELASAQVELTDYKEVNEDKKRLAREIGVALLGSEAPQQPSLCDLVKYAEELRAELNAAQAEAKKWHDAYESVRKAG